MNEKTNEKKVAAISYDHLTVTKDLTVGASSNRAVTLKSDGSVIATGTITGQTLTSTGNISSTSGTITGQTLTSTGNISATSGTITGQTLTSTGNISATSGTITGQTLTSTGNISATSGTITGKKLEVISEISIEDNPVIQSKNGNTIFFSSNNGHHFYVGKENGSIANNTVSSLEEANERPRPSDQDKAFEILQGRIQAYKTMKCQKDFYIFTNKGKNQKLFRRLQGSAESADDGKAYLSTSDSRLKKEIRPLQNAIEKLTRLQGVYFAWNEPGLQEKTKHVEENLRSAEDTPEANQKVWDAEKERIRKEHSGTYKGFIAQEVEKIFPEWVQKNEAGYKTIRMDELNVVLVEAVKELNVEVKELKTQNHALQAQNKAMMERLEALEKRV